MSGRGGGRGGRGYYDGGGYDYPNGGRGGRSGGNGEAYGGRGRGGGGRGGGNGGRGEFYGGRGNGEAYGGRGRGEINGGRGNGEAYGGRGRGEFNGGRGNGEGYGGRGRGEFNGGRGNGEERGRGGRGGRGNREQGATASFLPLTEKMWKEAAGQISSPPTMKGMKATAPPRRPGFGSIGEKCLLRANHFVVQAADLNLCHYHVTFTPEVALKKYSRDIISQLFKTNPSLNRLPAFDGRNSVYTAGALPFETCREFDVKLSKSRGDELEYKVELKLVGKVDDRQLNDFIAGKHNDSPQDIIQILDVVLRSTQSLNRFTLVGRSFFSKDLGNGPLGKGIEYWRGYTRVLDPLKWDSPLILMSNVYADVSATAFYEKMDVTIFLQQQLGRNITPTTQFSEQDRIKVKKALKGVRVSTYHGSKRDHKVIGVSTLPSHRETFCLGGTTTKSIAQYFKEKYNITLRYPSLPCLQCGSTKKPISLPMEVCCIVEGQKYPKKLDVNQVTALLKATCQRPYQRESSIIDMVRDTNYNADELVNREFKLHVADNITTIEGRVLPPPMLTYGHNANIAPKFGTWNMIDKQMYQGGTVRYWRCINFSRLPDARVEEFCYELAGMCSNKGMNFAPNPTHGPLAFRPDHIEVALEQVHANAVSERRQIDLLVIILPDGDTQYGKIKRICETKLGIVSQCCRPRHLMRISKQYLENLALKINVKAGGCNAVLKDAANRKIPLVTDQRTIVFGADVTHPPAGQDFGPSIAAVVGSLDFPEITKYKALVSAQTHREEIIQDLSRMVRELLVSFAEANRQQLPDSIIFYRDGVSEGQFAQVLKFEMEAIRTACESMKEGYLPRVTFIVVKKRHHTRLFPADPKIQDRNGNVLPGTVVDTKICHPSEYDFYLCSHAGIQGTNRPTHYHVLFDENQFSPDLLQLFTNSLCYTFARCTRSVSLVPPVYYAHLAAFRARYYIEGDNGSDSASIRSGDSSQVNNANTVCVLPAIKTNVNRVMFYC